MSAQGWPAGLRRLSKAEQRAARRRGLSDLEWAFALERNLGVCLGCGAWYRMADIGSSLQRCAPCVRDYSNARKERARR